MELPPSVPAALQDKAWLNETYREDRILVPDPSQFDVESYRQGSVDWALAHIDDWNREDAADPLQYCEYNWVENIDGQVRWRRAYGSPTDGIHRAAAAKRAGVPTWVTVVAYYFEKEAIEKHGLPVGREELAPWLVDVGDPPRPRHEVLTLPRYQPRDFLRTESPIEDGLLGFDRRGGVARVRIFELPERTEVLFSRVRRALGPSPYATLGGQLEAMAAIWSCLLVGRLRHPWDAEWWADPGGAGKVWDDATKHVTLATDKFGRFRFLALELPDDDMSGPTLVVPLSPSRGGRC